MAAAEEVSRLPSQNAKSVEIFHYTAGIGGVGATLLASTFLLFSEDVIFYDCKGNLVQRHPASEPQVVDFGGNVGVQNTYLLNLPEVHSLYESLLRPKGGGFVDANC